MFKAICVAGRKGLISMKLLVFGVLVILLSSLVFAQSVEEAEACPLYCKIINSIMESLKSISLSFENTEADVNDISSSLTAISEDVNNLGNSINSIVNKECNWEGKMDKFTSLESGPDSTEKQFILSRGNAAEVNYTDFLIYFNQGQQYSSTKLYLNGQFCKNIDVGAGLNEIYYISSCTNLLIEGLNTMSFTNGVFPSDPKYNLYLGKEYRPANC